MEHTPGALKGVGMTAFGVAMMRAHESRRADRLFNDPLAEVFADFAYQHFHGPTAPPGAEDTWNTVERLVEVFYDSRVVAVRVFDEFLIDAARHGCAQVVLLGAGLDARAFRLTWPAPVSFYEIDTAAMHDFKQPLVETAALNVVSRRLVRADLREDWPVVLNQAGHDPTVPTAWLAEGLLGYLPRVAARQLIHTVTAHSAPGSRLAFEYTPPADPRSATAAPSASAASLMDRVRAVPGSEKHFGLDEQRGLGDDAPEYLRELGWITTYRDGPTTARIYHRHLPDEHAFGYLTAEL